LLSRSNIVGFLLLALFAIGGGTTTAFAHAQHAHGVATDRFGAAESTEPSRLAHAVGVTAMQAQAAASHDHLGAIPGGSGRSGCCCDSVMCHASTTLGVDAFSLPCPAGAARVMAEPASGRPQRNTSGLDRPPRSSDIA
jgi:hypothetical protein